MRKRRRGLSRATVEKVMMVALPCIALSISYMILAPQLSFLKEQLEADRRKAEPMEIVAPVATQAPAISPVRSVQQSEADQCEPDTRTLNLSATTAGRELVVVVRDEEGNAVTGENFEITLHSSVMGDMQYYTTEAGSCYIVDLYPGEYSISMGDKPGYVTAPGITAQISAATQFQPIPDISQLLGIVDISQMPMEEIKDNTPEAPQEAVPEIIYTPPEIVQEQPVLDSAGRYVYSYTYNVGPNGFLMYRNGMESDVLPVDENNDGTLDYGLRYVAGEPAAEGMEEAPGYYVSVTLFNDDNSPAADYDIIATPLTRPASESLAGWKSENGRTYYRDINGNYVVGLKNIDGKLYYFNQRGEKASRLGVDVSCFNGTVNWNAVKAQGIDFVIVRVGGRGWESGLVYEDSMALDHIRGANAAGLKVGAYFYSAAVDATEAIQEASVVIEKLGGIGLEMPIYIDMEFSGNFPMGRADGLGTAQRVEIINAFCKTVENSGYAGGVYSGESLLSTAVDYNSISQYSIWIANYTENNALPTYPHSYNIWQFTDRGLVSGMGGNVDLNVIF